MHQIDDKQAYELLSREGFTVSESSRLIQLRRDYMAKKQKQTPRNHPFLRFVWWCLRVYLTDGVCDALREDFTEIKAKLR